MSIQEVIKKKFLIVGSQDPEGSKEHLSLYDKEGTLDIRLKNGKTYPIPRWYDGYLLHLSRIDEGDLSALRAEQPYSWIFGQTGASVVCPSLMENCDSIMMYQNSKFIVEYMQNWRKTRKI